MKAILSNFERNLLNKIIPTQSLNDSRGIKIALRNFIGDEREALIREKGLDEQTFRSLQSNTVKNIYQYLKDHDYIAEREGGVPFLTEKGKILRKQGSLEQFEVWQKETRANNKKVIQTIETKGYLQQDEIERNRRSLVMKRVRSFIIYPILGIILLGFLVVGIHKNNMDKDIPFIKEIFKNEKKYVQQMIRISDKC